MKKFASLIAVLAAIVATMVAAGTASATISISNISAGGTNQGHATPYTYTSPSMTVPANATLLLSVSADDAVSTSAPPYPTVSGLGLTWSVLSGTENNYDNTGTGRATNWTFYAVTGSSSVVGTISIDPGSRDLPGIRRVAYVLDAATGLYNASPVRTWGSARGTFGASSFSMSMDLSQWQPLDAVWGAVPVQCGASQTSAYVAGSGYTFVGKAETGYAQIGTEYQLGVPSTLSMSYDCYWPGNGSQPIYWNGGTYVGLRGA